jgi:hypothetical protein
MENVGKRFRDATDNFRRTSGVNELVFLSSLEAATVLRSSSLSS